MEPKGSVIITDASPPTGEDIVNLMYGSVDKLVQMILTNENGLYDRLVKLQSETA